MMPREGSRTSPRTPRSTSWGPMRLPFSWPLLLLLTATTMLLRELPTAAGLANISALYPQPLPFPTATHPLALSTSLFAASEPLPPRETAAINATAPRFLGDVPFPTGAWWTNLVLGDGASPVVSMPYVHRIKDGKLHCGYPFRVVLPHVIQNGFVAQLVFSSSASGPDQVPARQQVAGFDAFGVTVRFAREHAAGSFIAHLVRGSPFVTLEYNDTIPVIESLDGLLITRLKRHDELVDMQNRPLEFATFAVQLSNNQIWYIFASDPSVELQLIQGRVTTKGPYTGVLRAALAPTADALPYLLEGASVFPVGGRVTYSVDIQKQVANVKVHWKIRRFPGAVGVGELPSSTDATTASLLMLALPHHVDVLDSMSTIDTLRYTSIRGLMLGVRGQTWSLQEPLPTVEWDYGYSGLFDVRPGDDAAERAAMASKAKSEIIASLHEDIKAYPQLSPDSYNFGKQIGREARLLLTAARFNQTSIVNQVVAKMKRELEPWLTAKNSDQLVYDQTYGGVVTRGGLQDRGADFGNGFYNDHHFHYGYFVYALAVLGKFAPEFVEANKVAIGMLVGDIGTPLDESVAFLQDLPLTELFPVSRHKDWYVGHSYASGLFPMEVGKSQESSSEAVNAYYGLALIGALDSSAATNAQSYYNYARLLLGMELRSARKYWHMRENSQVYEPLFAKNAMIGVVGEMSVVYSTWFGDRPEYVHCINMIPFTPVTEELLNEAYVAREYELLRSDYKTMSASDIWKSSVVLDHAILDAAAAWKELTTEVTAFDTWNSRSNSLYWIASRPSWFAEKERAKLTEPNMHEEDKCFGYPACSVAGSNGTALQCCSSLPGCCPSSLGCCPKQDLSNLPLNACFGEHECAMLGLSCCNSMDGCCEPDPVTGVVLGCCKTRAPRPATAKPTVTTTTRDESGSNSAGFCTTQPRCAALKLLCCGSPEGCCQPDPATGVRLDCCEHETQPKEATCQNQPRCAAAKLDCCGSAKGCCQPDPVSGAVLDCCRTPQSAVMETSQDTCHNQLLCAKAGLDCCMTSKGCCVPDSVTGVKLLCCQDEPVSTPTSPSPNDQEAFGTCHGNLGCLAAGENGTALNCCATPEGCCPGLLCCNDAKDKRKARTSSTAQDGSDSGEPSTINRVFAIVVGVVLLGALVSCLTMCYRRRHYAPIDHDMRSYYCVAIMLVVVGFFVYMAVMA